jgi:RimJ/RimL family protein N-acetyltransferase
MKCRVNPRIYCKTIIRRNHKDIGRINLVKYLCGGLPHLEFSIDDDYRGKGIMSEELPKYLKNRALYQPRMLAVVKKDNVASCKVLEKNGFIKFGNFDEEFLYIAALDLTKEVKAFQKEVLKNYTW